MKIFKLSLATILTSTLIACSDAPVYEKAPIYVEIFEVENINQQKLRQFPAVVRASELTDLSFQLNGEVTQLSAKDGLKVKKGELLARLDSTTLELTLKEKKAKVDLSKVQAERAKIMVDKGNMPKSTFDELAAQYQMAKADYNYAKVQLDYVDLRAPFDGIVANVHIENYQAVTIGKPVITMHRIDKTELTVNLPDSLVASVDENKVDPENVWLDVRLDAYKDHVFKAKYKEHTAEQNEESRSFTLVLEMDVDPKRPALQGMPGSVELDLAKIEREDAYNSLVPLAAVVLPDNYQSDSFKQVVWRFNETNNSVEPVEVTTGRLSDLDHVEVIGGIKPGDKVIVKGLQYLKQGTEVTVVSATEVAG